MLKKISTLTLTILFVLISYGQAINPIVNYKYYIENEQMISENKLLYIPKAKAPTKAPNATPK